MASKKRQTRAQLDKKVLELEDKLKRALADYLNLEKRLEKEKGVFVKLANAQLLDKIFPVLDELEICERHLKNKGLAMVLAKFNQVLESEGVEEIKPKGEEFNPETMDVAEIASGPKNEVVEVICKGYKLNDKVLRPAKVKVGQGQKQK